MRSHTTAKEVIDPDIPGGLDVFIEDVTVTHGAGGSSQVTPINPELEETIPSPPGQTVSTAITVRNDASTSGGGLGGTNPDSCDGGSGTELTAVLSPSFDSFNYDTLCISDNGGEQTFINQTFAPDSTGTFTVEFWIEGANTDTRVTPVYAFDLVVSEGGGGDDPDNGNGGNGGNGSNGDNGGNGGNGGGGEQLSARLDDCGIQGSTDVSPGDRPVFEAQITNTSDSTIDLPVTLFVNGEAPFGEDMQPNIEPGETRTYLSDPELPQEGSYEYELELGEPTLA